MLEFSLGMLNNSTLLLFGVFVSAAILSIPFHKKNIIILLAFCVGVNAMQFASYAAIGLKGAMWWYPIVTHLPSVLLFSLYYKRKIIIMFKDETGEIVPAIVSEELWNKANAILKERSDDVKKRHGVCNHANLLTGKLFCTECGVAYYRWASIDKGGDKNSYWSCSNKIKNGADACPSFNIYEKEIKEILYAAFEQTRPDIEALLTTYQNMIEELERDGDVDKKLKKLQKDIEFTQSKKKKLLDLLTDDVVTVEEFKQRNKDCDNELESLQEQITELNTQITTTDEYKAHVKLIRETLIQAAEDAKKNIISKEFVDRYIDKIYVTPDTDDNGKSAKSIKLNIVIFTGKSTEILFERAGRAHNHMGNISLTI